MLGWYIDRHRPRRRLTRQEVDRAPGAVRTKIVSSDCQIAVATLHIRLNTVSEL